MNLKNKICLYLETERVVVNFILYIWFVNVAKL